MTATVSERSPQVGLFHGLRLDDEQLRLITARNPSPIDPEETWRAALLEWRAYAIMKGRAELAAMVPDMISADAIRKTLDHLWQLFFPRWVKATGPMIAEAYVKGFQMVRRDEVPMRMIYSLAEEHAKRVGTYFNETSSEAMVQGFEKFVNKQVPRKVALERVFESYGLSPRQVSGYVSAEQLWAAKTSSARSVSLTQKIKQYVSRSLSSRLGIFSRQEHHNLNQQAQQVAWMWMVENGKISEETQKQWLTAKDEKVCKVCGPMNSKKVPVKEKFELPDGNELFVPGAHVNCRCEVRLWTNPFTLVKKDWDPKEHPRGGNPKNSGQFSRKAPKPQVAEQERSQVLEDMLRQIREMQAQEPVIEQAPPEEKPKLSFTQPKLSFTEKPKLSFKPEAKPAEPEVQPQMSFKPVEEEKPKLSFAPVEESQPKLGFWTRPKMDFDLSHLVDLQTQRQTAEQDEAIYTVEETVTYSPTRRLYGREEEPGTGVVIVDPSQLTAGHDEVTILDGTQDKVRIIPSHLKERRVANMIHDAYDRQVGKVVWDKTSGAAEVEIRDFHGEDGEIVAYVPVDIVTQAAEIALKMPESPLTGDEYLDHEDARSKYDTAFKLNWMYDGSNEFVVERNGDDGEGEEVSWRELIQYLGIEKSDYQVVMVNIPEGYGNAYRLDEETWATPGRYTAANARQKFIEGRDGLLIPYLEVDARPNVTRRTETIHGGITEDMKRRWMADHPGEDWPYG